jgi:hypothetical protein
MEKKYAFLIIGILLAAFAIYAYNYPPVKTETESVSLSAKGESEPSKLRMGLIEEMVTNYRQTQLVSIENAPQNPVRDDSHSILFDLDTLKKFINDIERGVKEVEPSANPKLAIRMYYAAYPAKEKWYERGYEALGKFTNKEIPKLYERKHTIIMIPVIKTEKGIFADFNPFDKNTYNGFPKRATKAMSLLRNPSDTTEIPALNHGQLIPPASIEGEGF